VIFLEKPRIYVFYHKDPELMLARIVFT